MTAQKQDANGYISIDENPITQEGVFPYLGKEIDKNAVPDKVYYVYRPAEELMKDECMDSFKMLPLVNDHAMLGPTDKGYVAAEKKGVHGITGENISFKNGKLCANLKIFSESLARLIKSGKKDLSLGYRCVYDKMSGTFAGKSYDYIQRSLRGNHIALVDKARCDVSVLDHQKFAFDSFELAINTKDSEMEKEAAELKAKVEAQDKAIATVGESIKALTEVVTSIKTAQDAAAKEAEEKAKKEAEDEKAEAEKKKTDADKAMDSVIAPLREANDKLTKELDSLKKDGMKSMLSEVSARDALAKQLATHVGAFDHADKTLQEVAAYGIEKLGLTCEKGHEKAALDGFLAAAAKVKPVHTAAQDSKPKIKAVDQFLNQKGA